MKRLALVAVLLSPAALAQQPPGYIALGLKSSSPNSTQPGILFLDPLTGTATPVSSPTAGNTLTYVTSLSLGPSSMGTIAIGTRVGSQALPWIWRLPLAGNRYQTSSVFVPMNIPGLPYRVAHTRLAQAAVFTIRGGSANDLYHVDSKTKKLTRANTGITANVALAGDVVVLGDKAYAAFSMTTGTRRGIVVEWRLDGKSKPVQILSRANPIVAMRPFPSGLELLNDKGSIDLLTNTLAGWVPFTFLNTGITGTVGFVGGYWLGPQYYTYYLAVTNKQGGTDIIGWSSAAATKKIFTDPRAFGDLRRMSAIEGGVLFYGAGCAGTAGTPRMVLSGYPTQGSTTFAVAMQGGPAGSSALLAIGSKRANTSLAPLGAPGCFLYNDVLVVLGSKTTTTGTASFTAPVPTNASLRGLHVFGQWGMADRTANAAGLITTEGAEYVIY